MGFVDQGLLVRRPGWRVVVPVEPSQASTDIGNPNRVRVRKQEGGTHKSAADDISAMLPAADSND